jgi:hypothetical protein
LVIFVPNFSLFGGQKITKSWGQKFPKQAKVRDKNSQKLGAKIPQRGKN